MELAVKCAALAIFSALVSLMIRRMNPELSFALAAATVVTLLLASASLLEKTISSFREAEKPGAGGVVFTGMARACSSGTSPSEGAELHPAGAEPPGNS